MWLALASAALVVGLVWLDSGRTSPGPISATHAQDETLADDDCERCHGDAGARDMAAACGECHAPIAEEIAQHRGFHGTLANGVDATRCSTCHSEHHGREFRLVGPEVFALAGVADVAAYDHARLDFALAGRHATLACKACHAHADDELLHAGDRRFAGLTQRCESCHEDVHHGALPDCAACHGEEHPFAEVASFVHVASFPLEGAHAERACKTCHPADSEHAIEAERVLDPIASTPRATSTRACAACHASPHADAFVAEEARKRGLALDSSCAACHPIAHASFAEATGGFTRAEHDATGFPLDGPHAELACAACHVARPRADETVERATFASFRAAYPGRARDDCAACHGDPHLGQFAAGPFAGARCTACHERAHFTPSAFDVASHAKTAFPLRGAHEAVDCRSCHASTRTTEVAGKARTCRAFAGASTACRACHPDPHAGSFDRPGLPSSVEGAQDCERCHGADAFDRLARPFDHATWTAFPLEGAHARAKCESCHPRAARADATGRAFGRASDRFHGDLGACSTCHADAHAGAFDRASLPREVAGRAGCARCHDAESFRDVKGFDHAAWTGYALEGAHARASCESCHPRSSRADANGRSFGRCAVSAAKAATCTSCHADFHGGAFDRGTGPARVDGRTGCARCHSQDTFSDPTSSFDHAAWTGFALAGAHAKLACADCHAPASAGGVDVQSRARGRNCADCHVDPHAAQFARNGATDCARCHANGPDFAKLVFDHARDSRFALDATHAKLACAQCHAPAPLPDGTRTVRYKPLGVACADCHDARGPKRAKEGPR